MLIGERRALNNWARRFKTWVDPGNKTYKLQESLFGLFRWGEFKPLPKLDYVLVFRHFYAKCEACIIDDQQDNPYAYFQVSLVYKGNRRIIVHETRDREDAFSMAKSLGQELMLRIRDSSSGRTARWLHN